MRRRVEVWLYGVPVGELSQNNDGFTFIYHAGYVGPVLSLSLPVRSEAFHSTELPPFFASLAPEGWLRKRYCQLQKIDEHDLFGMLIENGKNMIGAVQIVRIQED